MKNQIKLLLIASLILLSNIVIGRVGFCGGGAHMGSGGFSGHSMSYGGGFHESESFSESHPYSSISESEISEEEIHPMYSGNTMVYYYLLMNHQTNQYDTVTANSPGELKSKIGNLSSDNTGLYLVMGVVALFVIVVFFIMISS